MLQYNVLHLIISIVLYFTLYSTTFQRNVLLLEQLLRHSYLRYVGTLQSKYQKLMMNLKNTEYRQNCGGFQYFFMACDPVLLVGDPSRLSCYPARGKKAHELMQNHVVELYFFFFP